LLETESLANTFSKILQEKNEALKAKETLAYQFFDLLNQSEESFKIQDDQMTTLFGNIEGTSMRIIDDYGEAIEN